jgi:hypothetical protein
LVHPCSFFMLFPTHVFMFNDSDQGLQSPPLVCFPFELLCVLNDIALLLACYSLLSSSFEPVGASLCVHETFLFRYCVFPLQVFFFIDSNKCLQSPSLVCFPFELLCVLNDIVLLLACYSLLSSSCFCSFTATSVCNLQVLYDFHSSSSVF